MKSTCTISIGPCSNMLNAVDVASYVIDLHGPLNYTVRNYAW
jgi:hypothetical protein